MTGNTVNVLIISCTREIAGKLAGKILNVLAVYQVSTWQVHCPFPCSVFVVYRVGTSGLVPSDNSGDAKFRFATSTKSGRGIDRRLIE